MDRTANFDRLPQHMHGALERYIDKGIPPGGFLTAVLSNDLRNAVGRADAENRERIGDYVIYLYNDAPSVCWGSPEKVEAWIAAGGLHGLAPAQQAAE